MPFDSSSDWTDEFDAFPAVSSVERNDTMEAES
jgi:hypothetical protein